MSRYPNGWNEVLEKYIGPVGVHISSNLNVIIHFPLKLYTWNERILCAGRGSRPFLGGGGNARKTVDQ